MGIRDKVQTKVSKAFDGKLADAVRSFSFERVEEGEVDPVTGAVTGGVSINVTGRGVFGGYSVEELAGSSYAGQGSTQGQHIERTDVKLTALQSEVVDQDGLPTPPVVGDRIVRDGLKYDVVNVEQDPTSSIWNVQLRRT